MKNAVKPSHGDGSDSGSSKPVPAGMDFAGLVSAIREVHAQCAAHVRRTVNTTLTVRNWVIGAYIREYEQNGADRAAYGVRLLETLAENCKMGWIAVIRGGIWGCVGNCSTPTQRFGNR
ncbi:MAG: hypothetical protein RRC34_06585 [Lentisphaeria bacterium]|nr:hypothetical protein [Lentisphaeria bacterium]